MRAIINRHAYRVEQGQKTDRTRADCESIMFTEPDRHFPTGLLWWVVAFAMAVAVIELSTGDYGDAAFQATVALLLVIQAMTQGRPVGWFRAAQWSLVMLMASLLVVRVMRWTGFL
jgi:hypothetical protein